MTEQPHPNEPTIAPNAPVVSAHEIEIDAPIDRVWGVLTGSSGGRRGTRT